MASSKYVVRNLWNIAPLLTTNLVNSGLVDTVFNTTLTKAAVTAFDDYTSIRRGTSLSSSPEAGDKETKSRTRRRRRTSPARQENTIESSSVRSEGAMILGNSTHISSDGMTLTDNDFFFEHQKTRGYRLANQAIANCDCTERLQEDYIVNTVAYYLDTVCGAKHLSDILLLGTGELSIDMWAAVQRGKGAYHADHVHEGALVSGVYYSAVPSGSAPLFLRKPKADDTRVDGSQSQTSDEVSDVIHVPMEGDLVLFPPWVEHGVPVAEEQAHIDSSSLTRVSFAFNVTGAFALGNEPWNVTRIQ